MKICAEFYADIDGRWPAQASPVRFVDSGLGKKP
jgi:hypothetical protein